MWKASFFHNLKTKFIYLSKNIMSKEIYSKTINSMIEWAMKKYNNVSLNNGVNFKLKNKEIFVKFDYNWQVFGYLMIDGKQVANFKQRIEKGGRIITDVDVMQYLPF